MDVPLMMLAAQVNTLHSTEHAGALQRLLQAQEPPGSLAAGLHLLAGRMEDLPQASTQVLQWAKRLEPRTAQELVDHLPHLPEAAQAPAFSGLLQACSALAPGPRTQRLKALADRSGRLAEPARSEAVPAVLAAAGSLATPQRWAVLKPLCQAACLLPVAEHAATWRAVVHSYLAVPPGQLDAALAQLHDQIRRRRNAAGAQRLDGPLTPTVLREVSNWQQEGGVLASGVRNTVLLMAIQGLDEMPPDRRPGLFRLALRCLPGVGQEHRRPMLAELAQAIGVLPDAARLPEWQATLQAVEQWPPGERVHLFDPVAAQIGALPMEARAAAFASLLQAHRGLPAQYHVLSVVALGTGCVAWPRAEWPRVLEQVLAESARIPEPQQRSLSLLALAGKFCLAEPALIGPRDLAQPDQPRLDVRLHCLDAVVASLPLWPPPPVEFVECVNVLSQDVEQRLRQRPDDATFLTRVLEHLHRLSCA